MHTKSLHNQSPSTNMNQTAPYWVTTKMLKEVFEKFPDLTVRETSAILTAFELGIVYALHKDIPEKKTCKLLDKGE